MYDLVGTHIILKETLLKLFSSYFPKPSQRKIHMFIYLALILQHVRACKHMSITCKFMS